MSGASDRKPPRRRRRWRTAFFVCCGVLLALGGVVAPGLMRARIASNETAALGTLRTLSTSQAQFQSACIVDQDGDGDGEFGFLAELAGTVDCRGAQGKIGAPAAPAFCASVLGDTAVAGEGIAAKSGYYFRLFLPTAAGTAVPEPGRAVPGRAADADVQELRYVIYAWPIRRGTTGNRAFTVTQQGEVFSTSNAEQGYDGLRKIPTPDAAFVATGDEVAANAEGQFVTGVTASDGYSWLPSG